MQEKKEMISKVEPKAKPKLTAAEKEERYQEHLKRVREGK